MGLIFLCACLRIMRERGAKRECDIDGRNKWPKANSGQAEARAQAPQSRRCDAKDGQTIARMMDGKPTAQAPQSRKLRLTASQRTKVRALGLGILLLLLARGPQARQVHKSAGESKDQNGVRMNKNGVGVENDIDGNKIDEHNITTSLE